MSQIQWNYVERVEGELDTIIQSRKEREVFIQGIWFAELGELLLAIDVLKEYTIKTADDWLGHYLLGELYAYHSSPPNWKEADQSFKKSREAAGNLNTYLQYGLVLMRKQEFGEAIYYLKAADDLCYNCTIVKSDILAEKRSSMESTIHDELAEISDLSLVDLFGTGLDIQFKKPADVVSITILEHSSKCYIEIGDYQAALWFLQKLIEINPKSKIYQLLEILVQFNYNTCLTFKKMEEAYNIAIDLSEKDKELIPLALTPELLCFVSEKHQGKCFGLCYYIQSQKSKQIQEINKAISVNPKCTTFILSHCHMLLITGDANQCEAILRKFIALYGQSKNQVALMLLGTALLVLNRLEEALFYLEGNIESGFNLSDETQLENYIKVARIYNNIYSHKKALEHLEKCKEGVIYNNKDTIKHQYQIELARSFLGLNHPRQALVEVKVNLKKEISNQDSLILMGQIYIELKQIATAKQIFEKMIDDEKIIQKGTCYFMGKIHLLEDPLDQNNIAQQMFKKQIIYDTNHSQSKFELGKIFYQKADYQTAKVYLFEAFQKVKVQDIHLELLSIVLWKLLHFKDLKEVLVKWEKDYPERSEELSYRIGQLSRYQLKDNSTADEYFSKYLKITFKSDNIYNDDIKLRRSNALQVIAQITQYKEPNYIDAIKLFEEVINLNPKNWDSYFQIAFIYLSQSKYKESQSFLDKGFAYNSQHAKGLINAAHIQLFSKKNPKEAVKLIKKSLLICDSYTNSYLILGYAYGKLNKIEKSIQCLENINNLSSTAKQQEKKNLYLGFAFYQINKFKEALNLLIPLQFFEKKARHAYYMGKCLQLNDQIESTKYFVKCTEFGKKKYYCNSVQSIFDHMEYKERTFSVWVQPLLSSLEKFKKDYPDFDESQLNKLIGIAYMEMGESSTQAIHYFERSLKNDPKNLECLMGKAQCLFALNQDKLEIVDSYLEEINKIVEKANDKLKENFQYNILMSKIMQRKNKIDEALFHAQIAIQGIHIFKESTNLFQRMQFEAIYQLANIQLDIPLKKEEGVKLLRSNEHHAPSKWRLGTLQTDQSIAVGLYDLAYAIDPQFAPCILSLARCKKVISENIQDAIKYYDLYFKRAELKSNLLKLELAECYIKYQQFEKAEELAQQVLLEEPNNYSAWKYKGLVQQGLKDYFKSLDYFNKAIQIQNDSAEVLFFMSQCEDKIGTNKKRVIELLEQAVNIDKLNSIYHFELGKMYFIENMYDEGEVVLNQCIKLNPSYEEALLCLGEFYLLKQNNINRAQELIERCHKINSKNLNCVKFLVDIYLETNEYSKIASLIVNHETSLENQPLIILDIAEKCLANTKKFQISVTKNLLSKVVESEIKELKILKDKAESDKKIILSDKITLIGARAQLYLALIAYYENKFKESSVINKKCSEKVAQMKVEDQILFYYLRGQVLFVNALPQNLQQVRMYLTKCIKLIEKKQTDKLSERWIQLIPTLKLTIAETFLEEKRISKFNKIVEQVKFTCQSQQISELPSAFYANSLIIKAEKEIMAPDSLLLFKKARFLLKEIVKIFPKSSIIHLRLGQVYLKLQKQSKALGSFKECLLYSSIQLESLISKPFREIELVHAHIAISLAYEQLDQKNNALDSIRILMKEFPNRLEPYARCAELLFSTEKYEEACEKASRVASSQRSNTRMHWIIGKCQMQLNHPDRAVAPFKRCKFYDPDFPEIDINLARAQEQSFDNQEAIETYFKVFQKNNLDPLILHKCIKVLTSLGKFDQAIALFEKAAIIFEQKGIPISPTVLYAVALLDKRRGHISKSIDQLRSIITQDHLQHDAYYTLCTTLFEQKQFSDTISVCQSYFKVIEVQTEIPLTNNLAKMHNVCGNTFAQTNDFSSSVTSFLTAINYEPKDSNIMINAGTSYLAMKQPQMALNLFQKAHAADKSSVVPLLFIGISQSKLGQLPLAVKTYKRCLQLNSFFTPAAINLSILLRKLRNPGEAIKTLLPIINDYPNFITLSYHLALAQFEVGETASTINLLQRLISSYSDNIQYTRNISADTLLTALPNYSPEVSSEEFAISYQLSRLKVPRKSDIILLLSRVYRKMNRIDNELKLLDNQIKNENEDNPLYRFAHAISLSLSNKSNLAIHELYSCLNNDDQRTPLYLIAIANEQHQRGYLREELETLQKCIQLSPLFVQAWDNLGSLYSQLGLLNFAVDAFKKSIELKPTNSNSHYNLGNVYLQLCQVNLAVQSYDKCIALDKHHLKAHYNLGIAYTNAESPDISAAVRQYNTCLKLDPLNFNTYLGKLHNLHKILVVKDF